MIEIVFSESAGGSLKVAQHFGEGKYRGVSTVVLGHSDGREPTQEELEQARQEFERKEQEAWEKAVPLGGRSSDVFCLAFSLSVGDISETIPGTKRKEVIENLYVRCYPEFDDFEAQELIDKVGENLEIISKRLQEGEAARIWYSDNPEELCGMYWFMSWLRQFYKEISLKVYVVKLPEQEEKDDNTIVQRYAWGDVGPEEWGKYASLQKEATEAFVKMCAMQWNILQQENAKLRATLNGKLVSVSEDIYDYYILQEISGCEDQFNEARLIGTVLGKYQLGISDSIIHLRIENMVNQGRLEVVKVAEKDRPVYSRTLRRVK